MSLRNSLALVVVAAASGGAVLMSGCALSSTATPLEDQGAAMEGHVHGGSQPVVGAHVHLMAAATTGYGAAAKSLLTSGTAGSDSYGGYVLTGSTGGFSITGDYQCTSGTQVYVLATGGNPGLGSGMSNPNLALMSAVGQCPASGTFVTAVPYIWVNEVSTVATAYALSGFMTDLSHVGSSGTPLALTGIADAFATAANLVSVSTGAALAATPSGTGVAPQAEVNTLANILASCVNSTGAGSTTCNTLFANAVNGTTQPTDTATAALNIAHNPGANLANLFALQQAVASPYAPALSAVPNDFTVAVTYTAGGINAPQSIAIDGAGDVWTANAVGTLSKINGVTGAGISPVTGYVGGGLYAPFSIAIDQSGNAWAVNPEDYNFLFGEYLAPASVSKFSSAGVPAVGSPYTGGGLSNGNQYSPRDIAFDANGNAWIANTGGGVTELNGSTGAAISPATAYPLSASSPNPSGVAIDAAGHVWVSGFTQNVISELSVATGAVLFTSSNGANGLQEPYAIAIDAANNLWIPNNFDSNTYTGDTMSEFSGSGAAVGLYGGGGLLDPDGVAVDGGGNVWVSNEIHGSISMFSNAGVAVSPGSGYQAAGLYLPIDIAVDPSGNVWVPNVSTSTGANGTSVTEFVGAGVPTVTPIATAVATNKLGARP